MARSDAGAVRMRCAIYARLSKEDEEKSCAESESIQNQKSLLIQYAVERGWDIARIYCDENYSGADAHRPDFCRMLADAEEGRFQVLLCKSQSRFTRDMELVEKYIHGKFPLWGVRFIAVADSVDTDVKGNKKARQINGLVNEWYLEDLSENIRMVFDIKRREGRYIGGSALYGYRKDPADKNHLLVDDEAAAVVRQIFNWSVQGHGRQAIASMLNAAGIPNPTQYKARRDGADVSQGVWSKTTVWRILRNEMYAGVMVQGRRRKVSYKSELVVAVPQEKWYRVDGTHEAIVDRETFDAVQRGLSLRAKADGTGEAHLLAGLVRCMDCGGTMCKTSNGRVAYLRCKQYAEGGSARSCARRSVRLDALIELVSEQVRRHVREGYVLHPEELLEEKLGGAGGAEQEKKRRPAQRARRGQALKTLYLDRVSGLVGEEQFRTLNAAFLEETAHLEQRLARLTDIPAWAMPECAERAATLLELETVPRALLVLLVEKIEVGRRDARSGQQEIHIRWRF